METMTQLRARMNHRATAARALLADQGDRKWTPALQSAFDALMEDYDQASESLEDMKVAREVRARAQAQTEALELFIRCHSEHYTPAVAAKIKAAMSTTTGSEGGLVVGSIVATEFTDAIKGYGWMRQVAEEITTGRGEAFSVPVSDGTDEVGELLGQNAAASLLDADFDVRLVPVYKVGSKVFKVPFELLIDSAVDVVQLVLQRARARIGRKQNQLFTTGTGTNEPTGIVTASSVGKVGASGQTTTILYDDLVDLADSVDEASLGMPDAQEGAPLVKSGWMMSQTTRKVVRKIKDTNGRPVWLPDGDQGAAYLMDYPVFINNDMPAPAASAKSVLFGNLASYLIRDALALQLFRLSDSAFSLNGQVGFMAVARAGGNLRDVTAVKHYQHSAT
ncbi:phage major capsid protein [Aquabacterium sp.]|uniref:phage major capsid protein n=1 Tax=Aquabacterium sp. TaxID=1872578 RepID=UPI003784407C